MKLKTEIEILQGRIRAVTGRSVFVKFNDCDDEALFKARECWTYEQGILNECEMANDVENCTMRDDEPNCCPQCREFWVINYSEAEALRVCGPIKEENCDEMPQDEWEHITDP
jgi:hypothetical protein